MAAWSYLLIRDRVMSAHARSPQHTLATRCTWINILKQLCVSVCVCLAAK